MAPCIITLKARRGLARMMLLIPALAMLLAGCEREAKPKAPQARPVRTVTVEKDEVGQSIVLTGQIRAENEAALAFRIGGRIIERSAGVGDHVEADQVLAKLDPQNELNSLRSARALIVSWFVAVLFAPLLGVWLLKKPVKPASEQQGAVVRIFRAILVGAMRMRWLTIALTLACFVASLLALPYVPRQFFPASDRPELVVDLTLPQNASIFASDQAAAKPDSILNGDPDVVRWSTYVGRGAIRFYLPLNVQLANDFFSQAVVVAKDVAARERLHAKLEKALAEQLPSVVARISPLELGPPVGWPVQYRVSGPDIAQVRAIALRLAEVMGANNNVKEVNFDWIEPSRKVRIQVDQDQARLLGLSSQALAEVLNTVMTGAPITQVRDNIYLINVVTRAQDEQRISLSTLRALQLPLPNGRTVPLSQVATFDFEQEFPLIWRRQRAPTLTVQADVAAGATPEAAVRSLAPAVEKLNANLPGGYRIAAGGTVEESAQSQASVFAKVPLMLFLMLLFLMAQLHSFSRLALVLSVVPMGLIGVVAALLISGRPLGFVAILGILALMGMIARNAVILIEQIETERAERRQTWDAGPPRSDRCGRSRPDRTHRRSSPARARSDLPPLGRRNLRPPPRPRPRQSLRPFCGPWPRRGRATRGRNPHMMAEAISPRPGAANGVVPKNGIGMAFWIAGVPGSADMVKVEAPSMIAAGIRRLGIPAERNSACAIGAMTKKATKRLTPP